MNILKGKIGSNGLNLKGLDPFLRALLVTDTTVTRFLEAYFWEEISIDVLYQREIPIEEDIKWLDIEMGSVVLKREVLLHGRESKRVYAIAESVIRSNLLESDIKESLLRGQIGIGEILNDSRIETFREILNLNMEVAGDLSRYLNIAPDDTIISREYRIFTRREPIILIKERFSPSSIRLGSDGI